ncbi:hypothetical protein HOLleu_37619 [Holothuria leucospilota]|uniref:Uncharacterized protein n=1 Tax=Holothuria leucospilota TaxID=206669 RepID=A0A9Q1BDG8_HOLLE|nr:hypothetical protein HOLleu_37619 [Holothuria leucospilota]
MDSRYVKRYCYQGKHHHQLAQSNFKIPPPQDEEEDNFDGNFFRGKPPIPLPSIKFHHKPKTVCSQENKTSQCSSVILQLAERQQGKVPDTTSSKEATTTIPPQGIRLSQQTPPLPTIRITTAEVEKRKVAACRNMNNRKDSFNREVRPRKYPSPSTSSGPGVSNRPVPSKRRHISPSVPPPLPPRVPLKALSISENDLLRCLEDRPPLPPKPASLSNFPSENEVELFSFSDPVFLEFTSRHNSFNFPPPLPPKVVARQPLPAIRRSTISLDDKSIFDRDFDFLSDMPNRRGTTGAESILRARYGEEKKTGCCTQCTRDCIVDTPECLMDIFC